ncbi:MAG: 4Fe-4S binding protein [Acidobacteria bacterium]|nr:MAG: 4Fe-4S binding protein [Acidobacteriota bacterium]REJ98046.1 MAG: 4Fe-4S binding protein [Acidobacteriota bacterium]REK16789.1 MAG: 4Fe-4S binding protein [Acidobacteriota bacterium]REK42700.1 MAG: 4Fe-4S binding protein [Acidobacteriota bacterium]
MAKDCTKGPGRKRKSIELPVLNDAAGKDGGIRKSRNAGWRAAVLITINLLMIAHIVQWLLMGETVSPIEPSEAMYTIQDGAVNAGFIFFSLAILATLIFGRFVCGWGCHIIALQDLCAWLLKKAGLKPRPFRSRLLVFIPLVVALYMFVWPTVYRTFLAEQKQPLIPEFSNHLITTDFWATFPPVAVAIPFLFICGFVTVYFLGSKGFCTYACPYGGFFAVADKVAPGRIRVTEDCEQCGHCTATCTSNVLVHKEVKEHGMVVDPGCMKCMDCVSVCPNDALYFGFGKPAVSVSEPVAKRYPLSWPEEIAGVAVFFLSFLAVWNVYQLVPMLMALGIASVTTFLVLKVWKLVTVKNQAFYGYSLRSSGKITAVGFVFASAAMLWIGLNVHSGWVRYHESAGTRAYEQVRIPDELALAQPDPRAWLSPDDLANIESGRKDLSRALAISLFTNSEALPKLAWLEYLGGNTDRAIELLERSADAQQGQAKALSLYYRGAILNRTRMFEEALASLDRSLEERPDLILARVERGESLWMLGKKQEAISVWKDAVAKNPRLALASDFLAGAYDSFGNTGESVKYEQLANSYTPSDPYFHWMLGLRLKHVGMDSLADERFEEAVRLNPSFRKLSSP